MKQVVFLFITALMLTINSAVSYGQVINPITVIDASNPAACDGSAVINNPNVVIPSSIVWYMNGAVFQQGGISVINLCSGTYMVNYYTPNDSVSAVFIISGTPCNGFMVLTSGTQASTPTSMDGTATVTVLGGTAPYAFLWNTGSISLTQTNLGVGMYSCCVSDANGCVSCDSFNVISTINPGNDTVLIINNNTIPNTFDSLTTQQVLDCVLDYNAVGGAYIINSSYVSSGAPALMDTIYLTWQVIDTIVPPNVLATYLVAYPIYPPLASSYTASLQVYCNLKTTNFNTLLAIDQFYTSQLSIPEEEFASIYLNPNTNSLVINFPMNQSGAALIYNVSGSLCASSNFTNSKQISLNTENWEKGIYLVKLSLANGKMQTIRVYR